MSAQIEKILREGNFSYGLGKDIMSLITLKGNNKDKIKVLNGVILSLKDEFYRLSTKPSVKKFKSKQTVVKAKEVAKKSLEKMEETPKKKSQATAKIGRKPITTFMKELTPSTDLAKIVGSKPLVRTKAVSLIWDYIKKHNLQDPKNKRNINCDATMQAVTGKKMVTMFELAGLIARHLN